MTTDAAAVQAASSLRGVRFSYGGADAFAMAVERLDLVPGEAAACIGPSGSGKSTLVHLMAGILVPDAGEVWLGEERIDALGEARRRAARAARIGLVFQSFELLEYLSALDNIVLPYRFVAARRGELDAARERGRALAAELGVADKLGRRPAHLSQGERQRVAIARALVTEPELVLCDEPTGNLDPETAGHALDLLLAAARDRGAALMMVTHDHTLLGRFDRVIDVRDLGGDAP